MKDDRYVVGAKVVLSAFNGKRKTQSKHVAFNRDALSLPENVQALRDGFNGITLPPWQVDVDSHASALAHDIIGVLADVAPPQVKVKRKSCITDSTWQLSLYVSGMRKIGATFRSDFADSLC